MDGKIPDQQKSATPISDMIRDMLAAGATAEVILIAVRACELSRDAFVTVRDGSPKTPAERSRAYREKNKIRHGSVTDRHAQNETPVTHRDEAPSPSPSPLVPPLSPAPLSPPIIPPTTPPSRAQRFDEFWKIYPKRAGNNSRKAALAKYDRAIGRGISEETLIAGAGRYRAWADASAKTGTELIQQTTTWLNQEGWNNEYTASRNSFNAAFNNLQREFERDDQAHDGSGGVESPDGFDFDG